MADDTEVGSPITLAELEAVGEFVRWQELGERVEELVASEQLPRGYPIAPSRLPGRTIDLWIDGRWRQVELVRREVDAWNQEQLVYLDGDAERAVAYDRYRVAPAGHFTEWDGARPESLAEAHLLDGFELAQPNHIIHEQELVDEDWPYLTFEVSSFDPDAHWVENFWTGSYTVHAADPRAEVEGVTPREPWFNTTIAVSHRWLDPRHPDPDGVQLDELLALARALGLQANQAFLIDYCSLPQQPRAPDEDRWFREQLPGFQEQFRYVTVVLNSGSADYSTRAWCMLELMLAASNRAERPTLLNHDLLDQPLREADQLARTYVQQSRWNEQEMSSAFAGGLTNATFNEWARDPVNVALYNARLEGRQKILERFESELEVTEPADRPLILELLQRLVL